MINNGRAQIGTTGRPDGHDYGAEVITAWQAILHPPGWTDAETAALAERGP